MTVTVAAYGAGVNSTALLVGLVERAFRPDAVLFADTGGEKPETYAYVEMFSSWLQDKGFPGIITVRNDGMYGTLENNCLSQQMLPSIAYGRRACSDKYKQRPQHKWCRQWAPALEAWKRNESVVKLIGYGADEQHRARMREDDYYRYRYPLIDWCWDRLACEEAIKRNRLAVPLKSACFFCPASTKPEILQLSIRHPDLFARAVAMEQNAAANLRSVKGLGRRFSWESFVQADQEQRRFFFDTLDTPSCMCFGETEEEAGENE